MIFGSKGPRSASPKAPSGSFDCGGIRDSPTHHSVPGPAGAGVLGGKWRLVEEGGEPAEVGGTRGERGREEKETKFNGRTL
jgi:hypothetical protein